MAVPSQETSAQWATYLDVEADVKAWLQIPVAAGDSQDVMLQLVTDAACQAVQRYLGRPVAPTTFFRRFSGWSGWTGAFITLPYYPVLQVKSVVEYWGASGPHTLTEQTPGNQSAGEVYQLDALRGHVIRTFYGLVQRPWFPGSRNVEIEWVAGYQPLPADLKMATLQLVARWWRNTQQASRSFQPRAEYDVEPQAGMWQGIPHDIEALLSPYLQVGIG